jgi:hypothetical protein
MHPIKFDARYEVQRARLTTFFRLLLAIPWLLWTLIYGIGACVVVFLAWFAMLFTKRYPASMYNFVAGYLRLVGRVTGYVVLLTDDFPPFHGRPDPSYPIEVQVDPPQPEYSRAKTCFKLLLFFPQCLILSGLNGVLEGAAFIAWFRILFTGKQSITMHESLRLAAAYSMRSVGFLLLLTEAHPRPLELPPQQPPLGAPGLPPAARGPEQGQLAG